MKKSSKLLSRKPLFLLLYLFLSVLIPEQLMASKALEPPQAIITGKVTDVNGLPLAGVNVIVESTDRGTISDLDGSFRIQVNSGETLVFSIVGFKSLRVPIEGADFVNVVLEEDVTQLGEVVLNAGYYTVSERERTGNIATIKADVMEKQPVGNPLAAMQGHMSGVNIVQSTGLPGGGYSIEVRGRNFINGATDPLFIVDGVPFGPQSLGASRVSNEILGGNVSPLNAINPNDIESIEVLKDADATAIYGSRGANGVVLITTKRGKAGKTRFDAQLSTSFGKVSRFLELMDTQQYLEVRREGVINDGYGSFLDNPSFDFVWPDIKSWDNDRYTDWQKELIGGTAYRNNAQLSISGGGQSTQFLISGAYQKETTVFPGDANYQRATIRSQVDHRSDNEKFKINMSMSYSNENNQMPGEDFTGKAYSLEPNAPALYDDEANLNWENNTWDNPLAALEESYVAKSNTLLSNAVISYAILPNLEFRSSMGFTSYRLDSYRAMPSSARNPSLGLTPQNYSHLITNASQRESWIVEPQLHWKKKWDLFSMDMLLGTTFQWETTDQLVVRGLGFPNNGLIHNLAAAQTLEVISDMDSEYRYNAVFGRINLKVLDRYILNITGRRDGSSRFGPGKQFGNFGAVGMAWIFSEEPIFGPESFLSFGKLRASYGSTGSDTIGDYRYLDTYSVSGNDYDGVTALEPTGIFNPQFGWEENRKLEAALELGFFYDRLVLNTSWYQNRSSNQLVGIPLATTTGFSQLTGNFDAVVENTGFEVDLQTANIQSKGLRWSTTFNLTVPKNRLVAFDGLETSTFANRYVVGEPLTIVKLYHALGVDPETGSYQFEDYNGDEGITRSEDRQWIEDLAPTYYGGLGNTLSLGNFTLDAFFQFKKQKAYNTLRYQSTPGFKGNGSVELFDRWQQPGDMVTIQRAYSGLAPTGGSDEFQKESSAAISNASFIRLRNVSVNYKVPTLEHGLDINVYLQGQNLWTITDYKGPDPEQPTSLRLPPLRQVSLGIQVSF
ncbi:TonB-linked outer membrane protein, SusC/RagA family [Flagellimonas taeanensis]|uniref:TonB-linked outer membrane protein, SusC/RagA family n=1 Tax=Flagellimonas taeanensis TaxID=1005926 RepID=A0A1M6XC07_9FLAO|nr:SusC/RagA family TonB-linked outer membrane protein [Allomuricauda taeanensis]SFB96175.1 TonB-linked outer membrane protein, SusC/RagA family [Allomuricauda taeanensis]SHL03335.1 TonB-linked outer membrane protein, SusC/RagA family [Allomuricauda taeanensis]